MSTIESHVQSNRLLHEVHEVQSSNYVIIMGDEITEDSLTATQELILEIDDKLAKAVGPFAWNIRVHSPIEDEEILSKLHGDFFHTINEKGEYFPELVFIYHLMASFQDVMTEDLPGAVESLNTAEETLAGIEQKGMLKNVENVLLHILVETKCHIYKKQQRLREAAELLKEIVHVDRMNNAELAMLHACYCSALSLYTTDNVMGLLCAQTAIKYEPGNGKWHFLLASNLREKRRKRFAPFQFPDEMEISAFQEAYRLFPNVLFGGSLAQVYREAQKYSEATEIYKEVYALQPTSCVVRLQLALGFIRANECILAADCLDYVGERMPDCCKYTHYKAIYEEKCNKDFWVSNNQSYILTAVYFSTIISGLQLLSFHSQAALPYYKMTTEMFNHTAEVQYMECRKKVNPEWDPLPYLLELTKKYEHHSPFVTQPINIEIGAYYLYEKHDVLSACQYLIKAVELDPKVKQLRKHCLLFRNQKQVNIYHTLAEEIETALRIGAAVYDEDQIQVLKHVLQLCHENCRDPCPRSDPSRTQGARARAQSPNSYRNYNRSSPSRVEITNWREEKRDTSFQRSPNHRFSGSNSNVVHTPRRSSTSSRKEDYTSRGSRGWRTEGNRSTPSSSNTFCNKKDSVSTYRDRGGSNRQANNDESAETDAATCYLVKTVKNLNL